MRRLSLITVVMIPGAASAHVGHLGELAGHDHWVAGAAVGAAAAITIWNVLKGKRKPADAAPEEDPETQEQSS